VLEQKLFGTFTKGDDPKRLDNIDFAPEESDMNAEIRRQCLPRFAPPAAPLDHISEVGIRHCEFDESSI